VVTRLTSAIPPCPEYYRAGGEQEPRARYFSEGRELTAAKLERVPSPLPKPLPPPPYAAGVVPENVPRGSGA